MQNKYVLSLDITGSKELLSAIFKSLYPDAKTPPPGCVIDIVMDKGVHLEITCKRVSLLRALFNSYFSILSMLIHVYEGLD